MDLVAERHDKPQPRQSRIDDLQEFLKSL